MNFVALSKNLCKIVKKYLYFACSYAIIKVLTGREGIPDVSVNLDNTAQSPPDGFVRNLLADFPPYCPEIPCHTSSMPAEFLGNLPKNLTTHLTHKLYALLSLLFYEKEFPHEIWLF